MDLLSGDREATGNACSLQTPFPGQCTNDEVCSLGLCAPFLPMGSSTFSGILPSAPILRGYDGQEVDRNTLSSRERCL